MKTTPLGTLLGLNNRLPRDKLSTENGVFMADAVNVDLHPGGKVKVRKNGRLILAGSRPHSLWEQLFVEGSTLYRLMGSVDAASKKALMSGLTEGLQVSFTRHVGLIHFGNVQGLWRLEDDTPHEVGIDPPAAEPTLTEFSGGGLTAGEYRVSVRYVASDGEYSGATKPVTISCADSSAINVSGIPQKAGMMVQVFVSPCNGTELFLVATTSSTSVNIMDALNTGARLDTLFKTRLPPGNIVRSHNGRLLTACGNFIFYTDPYSNLHDPVRNYLAFPEPVTMVEPVGSGGMFISADRTYWLSGDLAGESSQLLPVLPYKALPGASGKVPNKELAYWMSERGVVEGAPDGSVVNLQEDTVAVRPALQGAITYREEDGVKQIVASTFNPGVTVMAASTYMDAEVIHAIPQ